MRDRRQYRLTLLTMFGFAFAVVVLSVAILWRAWPIVAAQAQPTCGCSLVSPVSSTARLVAEGAIVVAGGLLALLVGGMTFAWWQQERFRRSLRGRVEYRTTHHGTNELITIIRDRRAQAFTLGWWRPSIYVTTGLVRQLTASEVTAVIRHEQSHRLWRDPLSATVVQGIVYGWGRFMPWIRLWAQMASSLRELVADGSATDQYDRTTALASAVAKLATTSSTALAAMSPNSSRVERLLNRNWQPRWLGWRWTYLTGAAAVLLGLAILGRAQPAIARPLAPTVGLCHQIQVLCREKNQQRQCQDPQGRCTQPVLLTVDQIRNFTPAND